MYIIEDLPDLNIPLIKCMNFRLINFYPDNNGCRLILNDFEKYDELLAILKGETKVQIIDTRNYWLTDFPIDINGVPMYVDRTHLSRRGSLFFSDKFIIK